MKQLLWLPLYLLPLTACGQKDEIYDDYTGKTVEGHDHDHDGDGKPDHADHEHDDHEHGDHDHDHDEVALGTMTIGEHQIECRQGHGPLVAGEESFLVVKLPFSDAGGTIVHAWIGTSDRSQAKVARATYSTADDQYTVHAVAPYPLPDGVQWWVELERLDGSKAIGSIQPTLP